MSNDYDNISQTFTALHEHQLVSLVWL